MKKMKTIEEIADTYRGLFASTGRLYYFIMYRSLCNLAKDAYNAVEISEEKIEENNLTL